MKKIFTALIAILLITILAILIILITYEIKYKKYSIKRIEKLEKIIELKQEINKEYAYLFKKIEDNNIEEEIKNLKTKIDNNATNVENLKNTISELQQENEKIKQEIEQIEYIKQEEKRKEQERIQSSTVKIEREITYSQFPNYPTGCESVALYILLKYNNVDVSVDDIVNKLKKGQLPYEIEDETYGGNPDIEFVGDPRNDYSYGVYNNPISEVANTFKENIQNKEGLELEEILEIVKEKKPVMVWTTIENLPSRISMIWTYRPTKETIYWKENEHAVVIIGYNEKQVIVSDPYTGTITKYNKEIFKQNYNYMGKRAVYY